MTMRRRRSDRHTYTIEPAPLPAPAPNWLTSLGNSIPMPYVLGGLIAFAVWYGTSNTKQENVQDVVKKLETKIEQVSTTATVSTKEQDDRRAAMAREFLASNKEIASKVGDLTTAIAVQQVQSKATNDALVKIGDQLQQLNSRGGGRP